MGLIKSWDKVKYGEYPVITDNLMNLELLFWAARNGGSSKYNDIATSHLDLTERDFFQTVCSPRGEGKWGGRGKGGEESVVWRRRR